MRHNPTKPSRPARLSTELGLDANRAGIRSLDCGHDEADDNVRLSRRSDDGSRAPSASGEQGDSFGEQRQSV
jgi:hypothetical protein